MSFDFADALQALGTIAVLLYLAPHVFKLKEPWSRWSVRAAFAAFALAFGAALWGAAGYFLAK